MYLCSLSRPAVRSSRWRQVSLPNGLTIAAEVMSTPAERAAGMQFRNGFEPGTVMLFVHPTEGRHTYHMGNMGFPLDAVLLDQMGLIIEVQHGIPGGRFGKVNHSALIEAPYGFASANNLKVGDRIRLS